MGLMSLLHALEALQEERGHLGKDDLRELADRLSVPQYRLQELVSFYPHLLTEPRSPITVQVCRDMSCHLGGAEGLAARLGEALEGHDDVLIEETSCLGCCERAPGVRVNGVPVRASDVEALAAVIREGGPARELRPQRTWQLDPHGGPEAAYEGIRMALAQDDPDEIADRLIADLEKSGLRGMGGAGFPTGLKWKLVRAEPATPKYVVCNADESEPGTFKDRVILEDLPYLVIEGMMLAGLTVGSSRGIIYLRHEYEDARTTIEREIERARDMGWLGQDVLGSGFDFDVEVFISPGGYILGEETALLEALEDRRGEPRNKPPFPGHKGLYGLPTLMNNVETFAHAAAIGAKGADWWIEHGVSGHAGLKFVAVSGHVESPGVYEIPMGTTVSDLIDLAGGVSGGRKLKAFAPGGASSHFLPADRADTPMDFEALAEAGSMMGSGALVVVAEGTPLLPLAANIVRFFRNESCGKCVPCRDGTEKATGMLERAVQSGESIDMDVIDKLNLLLTETSICGLGYVALNPLISIARHWPEEVPMANGGGVS
jgi:NADH:ubiquinone oxidoreductase subunit F (NADH-binding)/NADH:ubiquinone oxidoreductase subunit E